MEPRRASDKTVILGLDGVPWSLLRDLAGQGRLPALSRLLASSAAGPMNSTLPEISPVAWTTFFTARPPAEHGVFGFTEFSPGKYQVRFNSSADIRVPCLWDRLGLLDRRSVVLNVPLSYPARSLNGVMVSGFVALDYDRAAYPAWVADVLRGLDYRLEADFERVHQERDVFLSDLDAALDGRARLLDRFWQEPWDLFVLVVTDTDRLHHFFLREFMEGGPIEPYFHDFYRRVDGLVAQVTDRVHDLARAVEGGVRLVLLSDHGFGPVREEFHLNRWLAAHGFQDEAGPGALALALDPTRIYLNGPPRFRGGRAAPATYQDLARDITAGLTAEPAVDGVTPGREVYQGRQAHLAPHLVARPAPGYEFKAKFNHGPVYTASPLMGAHTFDDAFYLVHDTDGGLPEMDIRDILDLGRFVFKGLGVDTGEPASGLVV